jgi:collagenase-like PrtC family protease
LIVSYICFDFLASLKTIFVDKAENVLTLLKLIEEISTLKRIVLTKKLPEQKENEIREKAKNVGIEIMTYNQLRVKLPPNPVFSLHSYSLLGTWSI